MRADHPEILLLPYVRAELDSDECQRVEHHISGCRQCRATADSYSSILEKVARTGVAVPLPDWPSYNAELHRKMAARRSAPRRANRQFIFRSLIGAAAAATVAILIFLSVHSRPNLAPGVDQLTVETQIGNVDIGLIRDYPVIEHLDLLENYEVIDHLDQIAPAGNDAARS